jgi:predicted alpha/beta-hydrolase family hydrolase
MNPAPRRRRARCEQPGALLLFPGAGSDRNHATLVAIERAVAPLPVVRADFPYRREGRRAPDRAPKLLACVRDEAAALADRASTEPGRLLLGGRSMGGRMCSIAVADGLAAAGLVLVSYPLHPPGKPENLRTEHFPRLELPCLFVSGDRDSFGSPAELEAATAAIPGPVRHVFVPRGRHELRGADDQVVAAIVSWLRDQFGLVVDADS